MFLFLFGIILSIMIVKVLLSLSIASFCVRCLSHSLWRQIKEFIWADWFVQISFFAFLSFLILALIIYRWKKRSLLQLTLGLHSVESFIVSQYKLRLLGSYGAFLVGSVIFSLLRRSSPVLIKVFFFVTLKSLEDLGSVSSTVVVVLV